MFIIVDNTENDKILFSFWLNKKLVQRDYVTKNHKNIPVCLEKLLAGLKMTLSDITCLGVVVGAGKFTATRIATTTANTLAFALKIPVVALLKNFDEQTAVNLFKTAKAGQYVTPVYSGEPRLG